MTPIFKGEVPMTTNPRFASTDQVKAFNSLETGD